ncbi:MAG TPA: TPM domain-containing protein [Waterburya sp.]|jgi:uncharacterized protein
MFSVALIAKRLLVFFSVCLCFTLLLFPLPSSALTVQDVPNPGQNSGSWVTDMAKILSPDTEAKLNQIISELKGKTGDEIVVVTVPETTPAPSPKAFTTKLFKSWGISKKGVLLLVSNSDRRVEVATGYGIEPLLPEALLSGIIRQEILPQFKQGNIEGGILVGIQSLALKLGGNLTSVQDLAVDADNIANANQQSGYVALGILVITLLVLPSFWYFLSISRRNGVRDSSSELGGGSTGSEG